MTTTSSRFTRVARSFALVDRAVRLGLFFFIIGAAVSIPLRSCTCGHELDAMITARKPLVIINGQTQQIPSTDFVFSPGGASVVNGTGAIAGDLEVSEINHSTNPFNAPTTAMNLGNGAAAGPPTIQPVAVAGLAGNVNGPVRYAYTETFGSGETTLGPPSVSISPANKIVGVSSVGPPRRGSSQRKLYRSDNGDAFRLVFAFDGGGQYFQTTVSDNVASGSRGAVAPSSDASAVWNLTIDDSVKTWRSSPANGVNPADITVLTGDPTVSGAYAMDIYNTVAIRAYADDNLFMEKTGDGGDIIDIRHRPIDADDPTQTRLFTMKNNGTIIMAPSGGTVAMLDADFEAFGIQAKTSATPTQAQGGLNVDIATQGVDAQLRYSITGLLGPGYTGATETAAVRGGNHTAGTGGNVGVRGDAFGTARNTAVEGVAQLGIVNTGGYFGTDGLPNTNAFSAGLITQTGASGADMIIGLTSGAIKFELASGGFIYNYEIIIDTTAAAAIGACGGAGKSVVGGSMGGTTIVGAAGITCAWTVGSHPPGKGCTVTDRSRPITYTLVGAVITASAVVGGDVLDYNCTY